MTRKEIPTILKSRLRDLPLSAMYLKGIEAVAGEYATDFNETCRAILRRRKQLRERAVEITDLIAGKAVEKIDRNHEKEHLQFLAELTTRRRKYFLELIDQDVNYGKLPIRSRQVMVSALTEAYALGSTQKTPYETRQRMEKLMDESIDMFVTPPIQGNYEYSPWLMQWRAKSGSSIRWKIARGISEAIANAGKEKEVVKTLPRTAKDGDYTRLCRAIRPYIESGINVDTSGLCLGAPTMQLAKELADNVFSSIHYGLATDITPKQDHEKLDETHYRPTTPYYARHVLIQFPRKHRNIPAPDAMEVQITSLPFLLIRYFGSSKARTDIRNISIGWSEKGRSEKKLSQEILDIREGIYEMLRVYHPIHYLL